LALDAFDKNKLFHGEITVSPCQAEIARVD
jgi:hypothetical protein